MDYPTPLQRELSHNYRNNLSGVNIFITCLYCHEMQLMRLKIITWRYCNRNDKNWFNRMQKSTTDRCEEHFENEKVIFNEILKTIFDG